MRRNRTVFALSLVSLALAGCSGDKQEVKPPSIPIVGVLELPISLRVSMAQPADFADVEISPSEVHVAGQPVLTLAGGTVSAADRQGADLPKLGAALKTPLRSRIALSVSSSVPYETVALVLNTAKQAGFRGVALKVRAPGGGSSTGWISIDDFLVRPRSKGDEEVALQSVAARPWSDFTSRWDDIQNACRASPTGSCAYKPEKIAEGGNLKIVLHAAGQGVNVDFSRVGAPPAEEPKKKAKAELLEGVKAPTDVVKDVEDAPPADQASFQFRAQEAVAQPSAVSSTLKPLCGSRACAVVISAEKATLFVRIASLLGAAFPEGTPAPSVAFELP
ncbi:MAG TPA: hypothetical protein VF331_21570 [Polyangiales bacterium]